MFEFGRNNSQGHHYVGYNGQQTNEVNDVYLQATILRTKFDTSGYGTIRHDTARYCTIQNDTVR